AVCAPAWDTPAAPRSPSCSATRRSSALHRPASAKATSTTWQSRRRRRITGRSKTGRPAGSGISAQSGGRAAALTTTPPRQPDLPAASTRWAVRAVLLALVLAAFVNSLGAGLIFDNRAIVLEDPRLRAFTLEHLSQIVTR